MLENKKKLLVLTALESTWGKDENLLFLGDWCKLYERRNIWSTRAHEVLPFHWDDRNKLKYDYYYLQSLHNLLLNSLSEFLNKFHKTTYSVRYWQILLDPWLFSYVGVLFDRWENLRVLFEHESSVEVVFANVEKIDKPAFSYTEFDSQSLSDEWNQMILQRIIEKYYSDKCTVHAQRIDIDSFNTNIAFVEKNNSFLHRVSINIDRLLGLYFKKHDVVFFRSYFHNLPFIKLNLCIRHIPRLFINEFKLTDLLLNSFNPTVNLSLRKEISLSFIPKSQFEEFLNVSILKDLPIFLMESYVFIRNYVSSLSIKPKVIITANAHWNNILFKCWSAEKVNIGAKLVILEHGGSLPAKDWSFHFEENIADIVGTWFLPCHEKQIQVPPSKLVNQCKKSKKINRLIPARKYCSLIGNEYGRYVYRCHFSPMSSQCLESFNKTIDLYNLLDDTIKQNFLVKPNKVPQGFNTYKRYEDVLGRDKIFFQKISKIYNISRLIICTYPETTFSEAIISGVPTVLIYVKNHNERHSLTTPLLEALLEAKILFYDIEKAASHINKIWYDTTVWWSSSKVQHARSLFKNMALNFDKNWLKEWKGFIRTLTE